MTAAPPRTITELRSDSEGGRTSCWLINSFCWIVLMKPFSDIRALMYGLMDWAASNDRGIPGSLSHTVLQLWSQQQLWDVEGKKKKMETRERCGGVGESYMI